MLGLNLKSICYSLCEFEYRIKDGKKTVYNINSGSDIELNEKNELIWKMLVAANGNDVYDTTIANCLSRTFKLSPDDMMDTVKYVNSAINDFIEQRMIIIH